MNEEEKQVEGGSKQISEQKQPFQLEQQHQSQLLVVETKLSKMQQQEYAKTPIKNSIYLIPQQKESPSKQAISVSNQFSLGKKKIIKSDDQESAFGDEDISNTDFSIMTNNKYKLREEQSTHKSQFNEFSDYQMDGITTTKSEFGKKKSVDISSFLPPANPLAPKTFSEEFNVYTVFNMQFEKLPDFNQSEKYSFEEPQVSLKQLEPILEKIQGEKPRTLFEHHNMIRDRLVYERNRNLNLLQNPTRIKDTIFFSTIICKLNRLLRPDKKVFLQEQLKKDYEVKKTIKENAHRRKQAFTEGHHNDNKQKSKVIESQTLKMQPNTKSDNTQDQFQMNESIPESSSTILKNTVSSNNVKQIQSGNIENNENVSLCANVTSTITTMNESESINKLNTNTQISNSINSSSNSTNIRSNVINNEQLPQAKEHLVFSSEFESGNLYTAYQVTENHYELILQNDVNTKGNTQWFFFKVQNTKKNQTIKSGSLFNNGLCPAVFSQKRKDQTGTEWAREGFDIRYYKSNIFRDGFRISKFYCSLTFSYTFQYNQDTVYFAHSYPYTYSDLQEDLNKILSDKQKSEYISRKSLCSTLSGNSCDLLTITSTSAKKRGVRKGIVIFARQHPGETGGSFMMKGVIDFLLGPSREAEFLRDACIFKIVPMVNPDGVIHGNYRCDLAGADLNRRWKKPNKKLHPTIYSLKEMIKKLHTERETKLILDLHGHSRKLEAFFYGCSYREDPLKTRIFPYLLSKINSKISFSESRFSIDQYKESTARITLWKELRAPNVFCLEASFYGYKKRSNAKKSSNSQLSQEETLTSLRAKENKEILLNPKANLLIENNKEQKVQHFTIQDFYDIGRDICINLYNLIQQEVAQRESKGAFIIDQNSSLHNQIQEIAENKDLLENGNQADSGSDSNPSEDDLDDEEMLDIIPKNALSKKQKQILDERLKKEKNDKKKVKVQLIQEQSNQQNQLEIKRKQTNQMYLQRYLQKQQEKLAQNKGKGVQKRDQDQQTDASFLYDLFLYMEKKRQLLLNNPTASDAKDIDSQQNSQLKSPDTLLQQSPFKQQQLNPSGISIGIQQDSQNIQEQSKLPIQNSIEQNNNQNIQATNLPPPPAHSLIQMNIKENSNLNNSIYNQTLHSHLVSTLNQVNQMGSLNAKKGINSESDLSQEQKKQIQAEENQNNLIDKTYQQYESSSIKKGVSQSSMHNLRVKSLDQGNKQIIAPQGSKFSQQVAISSSALANSDHKNKNESQRGQSSLRIIQRQQNHPASQSNFTNVLATLSENQPNSGQTETEQTPILLKKNNEFGFERKREISMSFSYGNINVSGNLKNSFSGKKVFENNPNAVYESNTRYENIRAGINARTSGIINSDSKNHSNTKKSIHKESKDPIKVKILYNQKRQENQYFSSVDFSQIQNSTVLKQPINNNNLDRNNSSNVSNRINFVSSSLNGSLPQNQDQQNTQNYGPSNTQGASSFLPSIGSPKQQLSMNNLGSSFKIQNESSSSNQYPSSNQQPTSNFSKNQTGNNMQSGAGTVSNNNNNIINAINMAMANTNKPSGQFNPNNLQAKASYQNQPREIFGKSQSVQLLYKTKQTIISNKQKM